MAVRGPWYLSVSAVRDYLRIMGRPDATDGPVFHRAEEELMRICERAAELADAKPDGPSLGKSGSLLYRGGKPLRLRLLVAPDPREEGRLPQLVRVLPAHERQTPEQAQALLRGERRRPERTLRERAEDALEEVTRLLPALQSSQLRKIVEALERVLGARDDE